MTINDYIWRHLSTNNQIKRKKYEENALFNFDRAFRTQLNMTISQLDASKKSQHSKKNFDYKNIFEYDIECFYKLINESDVVSFDIFDTLVYRPVSDPKDLFWLLELDNHIFDFKNKRILAERLARSKSHKSYGEVDIWDIYDAFCEIQRCSKDDMVKAELEIEKKLCFKNEFAYKLYFYAKSKNKHIIAVSDMYLPSSFLHELLEGLLIDIDEIYVSNELEKTKWSGSLNKYISNIYRDLKILHIGDNKIADYKMSKKCGWNTILLNNVNILGSNYRNYCYGNIIGSIYSSICNVKMYSGIKDSKDQYYKYGFLYGGILTVGFCQWISELKQKCNYDQLIFIGRDCYIINKIYKKYFSDENISYLEISRFAMLPLVSYMSFESYIRDAFEDKIGLGMTLVEIFDTLGLDINFHSIFHNCFQEHDVLSWENYDSFREQLFNHKDIIINSYNNSRECLTEYLKSIFDKEKKICIIDLGWRGSAALNISKYFELVSDSYNIECALMASDDLSSTQMSVASGMIHSFLFSPINNCDIYDLGNNNFFSGGKFKFLEYMFSSCDNSVLRYLKNDQNIIEAVRENKDVSHNNNILTSIHNGIEDFAGEYFARLPDLAKKITIGPYWSFEPLLNVIKCFDVDEVFRGYNENAGNFHGF